jgi:hypothetical protein
VIEGAWPGIRVVRAALVGTHRLVFRTERGQTAAGVRSRFPWILWTGVHAYCERCQTVAENPPPMELDKEKAVLMEQPSVHATHILAALLHPFARQHETCALPEAA